MRTKIYTMTHKRFSEPEDNTLYIPLHVGRALGRDLDYIGDNTGEHISTWNDRYGELTGVYWVWKNDIDADIIGICYYRRFFVDSERNLLKQAEQEIDVSSYELYNRRAFGFLSEQLLLLWITKNGLKAYECLVGITAKKAETVELKLAVSQLVKMGGISQAKELFYEMLHIRPDVRLELSGIKGEIPVIEQLLYIMEEEWGIAGLYQYSIHLDRLISHYRGVVEILKSCGQGRFEEAHRQYLLKNRVSWVMAAVMLMNCPVMILDKAAALEQVKQFYIQAGKTEDAKALEGVQLI